MQRQTTHMFRFSSLLSSLRNELFCREDF